MSLRCYYCDYSEDTPSIYRSSLHVPNTHSRVTMDPKTGHPVCSFCSSEINSDLLGADDDYIPFEGSIRERTN